MSAVLLRFCLKCGLTALNTIWKQDRRFMESIIRFWERRVRARIACMFIQVFDNLPNTTLLIELSLNANPSTASYKVCGNAGAERGFNKVTESHKLPVWTCIRTNINGISARGWHPTESPSPDDTMLTIQELGKPIQRNGCTPSFRRPLGQRYMNWH